MSNRFQKGNWSPCGAGRIWQMFFSWHFQSADYMVWNSADSSRCGLPQRYGRVHKISRWFLSFPLSKAEFKIVAPFSQSSAQSFIARLQKVIKVLIQLTCCPNLIRARVELLLYLTHIERLTGDTFHFKTTLKLKPNTTSFNGSSEVFGSSEYQSGWVMTDFFCISLFIFKLASVNAFR